MIMIINVDRIILSIVLSSWLLLCMKVSAQVIKKDNNILANTIR